MTGKIDMGSQQKKEQGTIPEETVYGVKQGKKCRHRVLDLSTFLYVYAGKIISMRICSKRNDFIMGIFVGECYNYRCYYFYNANGEEPDDDLMDLFTQATDSENNSQ